jgi:hypothetical protein
MAWLDVFKKKQKTECFICAAKHLKKDMVTVKYRYGPGEGAVGTAHMCNKCNEKYTTKSEDEDYVESI